MAKKPKSIYLSDHWTTDDALKFGVFQPALMDILEHADTPLTVGVFGTWGSGKTSLLRMLEEKIKHRGLPGLRPVWFTAWKYDKQDALWRAFILRVIDALYPREKGNRIPLENLEDKNQQEAVKHLDRLAESLYQTVSWKGEESWSLDLAKTGKELVKLPMWLALHLAKLGDAAGDLGIKPDLADLIGREAQTHYMRQLESMEQFENSFEEALGKALGSDGRLVVFVDDLDRCLPEKAVEILEAIKLFLNVPQTIFVLGMDREIVRRGIESHYGIFLRPAEGEQRGELPINGDVYLQKLIQLPFNLPPLDISGREQFIKELEKQMAEGASLDDLTCQVFARGLLPNPRQVKRALNVFNLLRAIAVEQEAQKLIDPESIAWPLLAKTVLIQSQWPELYALWRQYPTLVQTLEEEYRRQPLTERELIFGQREEVPEKASEEETENEETPDTRQKSSTPRLSTGGILGPFIKDRQKYALLVSLLTFPDEIGKGRQRARFSGLSRRQLQAYLGLAGTAEQEPAKPADGSLPSDLSQQLSSGDQAILNEVLASIDEQEESSDGPLHQGARRILVQTAQSLELDPVKRAASAGSADYLDFLPDDLYSFIPIPNENQPQFFIARYPVTNAQYMRFINVVTKPDFSEKDLWLNFPKFDENGKLMQGDWGEEAWNWLKKALEGKSRDVVSRGSLENENFGAVRNATPAVNVTWYAANAYCKWLLKNWNELDEGQGDLPKPKLIRLPSEEEWVLAAGGEENNRYPWDADQVITEGEEILRRANVRESGIRRTTPVWMYPEGASPYGLMDMSGNAWEWQANHYSGKQTALALRGGSWSNIHRDARVAGRDSYDPHYSNSGIGFRVLALPK
jgi:formylglycine-generating enzyme required for sulfatase activity